jgi:hypothetical protein
VICILSSPDISVHIVCFNGCLHFNATPSRDDQMSCLSSCHPCMYKWQTRPLVRECAPQKQDRNCQTVINIWLWAPGGARYQDLLTDWLTDWLTVSPSLTRGRVCLLYMQLTLARVVFLGSEFLGTLDHILLSQIWDFPFCRLLRLPGSRWKYSTPLPHGETPPTHSELRIEQSRAVSYCRKPASTVTPGVEPRWDPWPYICSVSRLLLFFFFRCSSFDKGRGWAFL